MGRGETRARLPSLLLFFCSWIKIPLCSVNSRVHRGLACPPLSSQRGRNGSAVVPDARVRALQLTREEEKAKGHAHAFALGEQRRFERAAGDETEKKLRLRSAQGWRREAAANGKTRGDEGGAERRERRRARDASARKRRLRAQRGSETRFWVQRERKDVQGTKWERAGGRRGSERVGLDAENAAFARSEMRGKEREKEK